MQRIQLVAAILVCAVISLSGAGPAPDASRPTISSVTMDAAGGHTTAFGNNALSANGSGSRW
jgi:hypothetical protein